MIAAGQSQSQVPKKSASSKTKKETKKDKCLKSNSSGSGHWKGYDLRALEVPQCAWPTQDKEYKGRHGYTVTCPTTNAAP